MFIDYTKIYVKAGDGGNGCMSFRREKNVALGGPDGGNGGDGGYIYLRSNNNLKTLYDVHRHPHYKAERGAHGQGSTKHGASANPLYVDVPAGTQVYSFNTTSNKKEFIADLLHNGDSVIVAHGGKGGRGNASFKTSKRTAPRIAELGYPGEEFTLYLELKMIAEIGIIGLPNAGKSTFLSRVTHAKPKIADYPFTTLFPNLGMAEIDNNRYILADIPGLIEGASLGVGLGDKFLRHVERTKVFLHLIDVNNYNNKSIYQNFKAINKELGLYNKDLLKRKQVVGITKIDTIDNDKDIKKEMDKIKKDKEVKVSGVFMVSSVSGLGLNKLLRKTVSVASSIQEILLEEETVTYKKFIYEPDFVIEKKGNVFYVRGKKIEELVHVTRFEELEAMQRFQNIIKKMGLDGELKRKGAKKGDKVYIGDFELIFE